MGSHLWLLPLLLSLSDARTLKLLNNINKIPTTTANPSTLPPTTQDGIESTTFSVVDHLPSTTVPTHTTEYTTESAIEHLVAFTDTTSSTLEQELLLRGDNETISLDEFEVYNVSSTVATIETTTVPKGMIRQCRCSEVIACKAEAKNETENCFETCDEQLGFLGNETLSYIECFEKNQAGISHAEECLESALGSVCSTSLTPQYLEARDHEDYLKTKFIQNKEPKKTRPLLHKTHHILTGFQEFYHCSKHCIHRRMTKCFREKNCSIKLPSVPSFGETMNSCARNNLKVSRSLRSTCQCLLHKKKLKQLAGSCAVITPSRVKTL